MPFLNNYGKEGCDQLNICNFAFYTPWRFVNKVFSADCNFQKVQKDVQQFKGFKINSGKAKKAETMKGCYTKSVKMK